MVGCVLSQLKPSELSILSCEKGLGLRPGPFSQLRMESSSSYILYIKITAFRAGTVFISQNLTSVDVRF